LIEVRAGKTNLLAEVAQIVDHVVIIREAARSRASGSPRRGTHDRTTERSGDGAMELPSHPESEGPASGPHPGPTPGGRGTVAVLVVVAALVAVIVILHLTGAVGPGAHGS
jgi:hypothetical protein